MGSEKYIYDPIIDKTVIYIQMHVKIIQIATCLLEIHKHDIPYSFTSRQLSMKNISFTVSWKDIDLQFKKKCYQFIWDVHVNRDEYYTYFRLNVGMSYQKKKLGTELITSHIKLHRNWSTNIIWNLLINL